MKRLRYIIDPLSETIAGAASLLDDLSKLQDELGALHDSQIFGSEIAKRLAKVLASAAPDSRDGGAESDAPASRDHADALRAISQRLHREELRVFESLGEHWLSGGADELWLRADSIANALEAIRT